MAAFFPAGILMIAAAFLFPATSSSSFPATLMLERGIPPSHMVDLNELRRRDRLRHGRILESSSVVDFPVQGTFNPYLVGLYYTKVQLGSPPKDFYVQIDTGSDVLWVGCSSCNGCPATSGLQIPLSFFDPGSSSTAKLISCSDQRCSAGIQSADSVCASQTNQCAYTFQYGDGSGTSGYYVADLLHLDTVSGGSVTSNSSAPVVFGCSISQSGDLTKSERAVDGIFGFGQQSMSVISQLSSQGITPNVFSHCLKGDDSGGGILVLGEIIEPNIVYTPLVPSQTHYNLNLQSIVVGGQTLAIDSSVFGSSSNQGTIVDSGTTLAYLAEGAYDPFLNAIISAVSQNARPFIGGGNQCFLVTSSVNDIFPQVSFIFAGGASMVLNPQEYLLPPTNTVAGARGWCMGFQKTPGQEITILGDLVLKDKIVVYDIGNQRVGWTNYDCSTSVNVSTAKNTGKSEFVNAGQFGNSSERNLPYKLIAMLVHMFIISNYLFL
ncbi:Eukaryotic aspartyl protease family protein [Euphorbia peplus]|nr:Eukaryotic aspartyl protease family protein [Euphorbia peplus]